jgi:hypothetical protein
MRAGKTLRVINKALIYYKDHPEETIFTNSEDIKVILLASCPSAKVEVIKYPYKDKK